MTSTETSLSVFYRSLKRGKNILLVLLILAATVIRLGASLGQRLNYDEPFWLVRGDYLVSTLWGGDWRALQEKHWTLRESANGDRLYYPEVATGIPVALLTGLGMRLGARSGATTPIGKVLSGIVGARLPHVLCSALTPVLLMLLCARLGLPWTGQCALVLYLACEEIIWTIGSQCHLEAVLTLTIPASLLLYVLARQRDSLLVLTGGGILFGLAFSTRYNAGIVPIVALAWGLIGVFSARHPQGQLLSELGKEIRQVALFGLVGWAVFIISFPPLWKSPVLGFFDFLYQNASLAASPARASEASLFSIFIQPGLRLLLLGFTGIGLLWRPVRSNRLFQAGFLLFLLGTILVRLPASPYTRYLSSSLPGMAIAGSLSFSLLWDRWRQKPVWMGPTLASGIVLFATVLTVSLTAHQWRGFAEVRAGYGRLDSLQFARLDVPGFHSSFYRKNGDYGGPLLRILSALPHIHLAYLGVLLTDGRRFDLLDSHWSSGAIESDFPCDGRNWELTESRPRRLRKEGAVRLGGRSVAWPCQQ